MRRIKSLHESCTLHHTRRSAAADHIDIISLGLVFGEHPACNVLRIATEEIDLNKGILFFKTFFERPYDLIDNEAGVEGNLAFFLGTFDQDLLPLARFHRRDLLDAGAPRKARETSGAQGCRNQETSADSRRSSFTKRHHLRN